MPPTLRTGCDRPLTRANAHVEPEVRLSSIVSIVAHATDLTDAQWWLACVGSLVTRL
jgi:hypothetical protein